MKSHGLITIAAWSILMLSFLTTVPAYCQVDDYVLLMRQTPEQGGQVTPSAGVHRFGQDDVITLTAVPNPGYQFMYWMGDVTEVTKSSTMVLLNGPKIIVAVFERTDFMFIMDEETQPKGVGREISMRNLVYLGGGGGGGSAYKEPKEFRWTPPEESDFPVPEPPEDEFPVPEPAFPVPDNEVPIPEPATIALMGFGALAFVRKRRFG
jgi:hypothetical protein